MLQGQEARGQAWNASQSPVYLNNEASQVGIGTQLPQKTLHLREAQFISTFFPGEPPFPIPTCSNGFPTIRLSPLTFDASQTQITDCPDPSDARNNWDIEGATNKLGIRFNLQERLSLTGNGNLGIGITSPNYPLSLGTRGGNTLIALYEANGGQDVYGFGFGDGAQFRIHLGASGSSVGRFSFLNAPNGTELFTIRGSGNLGIGNTNPADALSIGGSGIRRIGISSSNDQAGISFASNGTGPFIVYSPSNTNDLRFFTDQDRFAFTSSGNFGIGENNPGSRLLVRSNNDVGTNNFAQFLSNNGTQGIGIGFNSINAIGSLANQDIIINPKGAGNVGIGVSTPAIRLQVANGNIGQSTTGSFGNPADRWMAMGAGNFPSPTFQNFHGTFVNWGSRSFVTGMVEGNGQRDGIIAWQDQTGSNPNRLRIGSISGTAPSQTSFTQHATILSNGKVGLGIENPISKLSLGNDFATTKLALFDGGNFSFGIGVQAFKMIFHNGSDVDDFVFKTDPFNPNDLMVIKGNGKVGIGTTDAQLALGNARLYVAGNILCEEVKVELRGTWPDFVFAKDYPLLSLEQKAEYIEKNSHLPNVPSAKEVAANGVELGKMDATLLRQIEELTLHMIELKKQNDLLQKQVEVLAEKVSNK
jgi:hypothetical protein